MINRGTTRHGTCFHDINKVAHSRTLEEGRTGSEWVGEVRWFRTDSYMFVLFCF